MNVCVALFNIFTQCRETAFNLIHPPTRQNAYHKPLWSSSKAIQLFTQPGLRGSSDPDANKVVGTQQEEGWLEGERKKDECFLMAFDNSNCFIIEQNNSTQIDNRLQCMRAYFP